MSEATKARERVDALRQLQAAVWAYERAEYKLWNALDCYAMLPTPGNKKVVERERPLVVEAEAAFRAALALLDAL